MICWTQIYNFLAAKAIYTNKASNVIVILYILGLNSIFSDHRTLKFLKVKCNPTNKKMWPETIHCCLQDSYVILVRAFD